MLAVKVMQTDVMLLRLHMPSCVIRLDTNFGSDYMQFPLLFSNQHSYALTAQLKQMHYLPISDLPANTMIS